MNCLASEDHWYNSGKHVMGVTKHFLIGVKAFSQDGTCNWHRDGVHKIVARQVTSPRGNPTTMILLNRHGLKAIPNDSSFHSHKIVRLSTFIGEACFCCR